MRLAAVRSWATFTKSAAPIKGHVAPGLGVGGGDVMDEFADAVNPRSRERGVANCT